MIENLDSKTRRNAWWDNMMGDNSEWKENFSLSQPTPRLFFCPTSWMILKQLDPCPQGPRDGLIVNYTQTGFIA